MPEGRHSGRRGTLSRAAFLSPLRKAASGRAGDIMQGKVESHALLVVITSLVYVYNKPCYRD